MTTNANDVGQAAQAWGTAIVRLVQAVPGGLREEGSNGTLLAFTGAPAASLNGVISIATEPDPDEIAVLAATAEKWAGVPWCIEVRGEPSEVVGRIAADYGLTELSRTPFMLCSLGDWEAPQSRLGDSVTVRTVPGKEYELYTKTLAAGFEAPPEIFANITSQPVLDAPGMTAYLVEEDGVPAATGFGMLLGDHVGVFNISTLPQYRNRGYGRAVTETVIRDGRAAGARAAFLHSSAQGRKVYEALGFRTAEQWTRFIAP